MFRDAGADLIDCSSGQVSKEERPVYGRLFQTPFADQIRNEGRSRRSRSGRSPRPITPTRSSPQDAPISAPSLAPHLADPAWTIHEAAKIGANIVPWPKQYASARGQYEANLARAASACSMSRGFARGPACAGHRRRRRHRRGDRRGSPARARALALQAAGQSLCEAVGGFGCPQAPRRRSTAST